MKLLMLVPSLWFMLFTPKTVVAATIKELTAYHLAIDKSDVIGLIQKH